MEWITVATLVSAGLAAGFIAGLIGLGGGVIFAPVLFFFFQQQGVPPELVSKLTAGSSLFCTFVAAGTSTWFQEQRAAVTWRVVVVVGLFSAAAVVAVTRYVTTQLWYDQAAFQAVFSLVLIGVVARMLMSSDDGSRDEPATSETPRRRHTPLLAGTGAAAGSIATAAGVGGGIVLVPAYGRFLRMPMHQAVGTSSATIVLISLVGVSSYAVMGWGMADTPGVTLGYVDVGYALLLAGPSVLSAQLGVYVSHRIETRALRWSFAAVAFFLAAQMLYDALL